MKIEDGRIDDCFVLVFVDDFFKYCNSLMIKMGMDNRYSI